MSHSLVQGTARSWHGKGCQRRGRTTAVFFPTDATRAVAKTPHPLTTSTEFPACRRRLCRCLTDSGGTWHCCPAVNDVSGTKQRRSCVSCRTCTLPEHYTIAHLLRVAFLFESVRNQRTRARLCQASLLQQRLPPSSKRELWVGVNPGVLQALASSMRSTCPSAWRDGFPLPPLQWSCSREPQHSST